MFKINANVRKKNQLIIVSNIFITFEDYLKRFYHGNN